MNTSRVPPGVPSGGQFSAQVKSEAEFDLTNTEQASPFEQATDEGELDEIHEALRDAAASAAERDRINHEYAMACNQMVPIEHQYWRHLDGNEQAGMTKLSPTQLGRVTERLTAGPDWGFRGVDSRQRMEILRQVGHGNVLAISGGRFTPLPDGVEMPVSGGYQVRVRLMASDTYQVERIFGRGDKEWIRGIREDVHATEVGQAAYYAGMFRSYDEGEWEDQR